MQRHRRLSGARAALDHHDAAGGVADDLVLLALDRFHDGAHVAGAGLVHCSAQRRLGADAGVGGFRAVAGERLVINRRDCAPPHADVAARFHALRVRGGRQVERAREGSAPVQQEGAVIVLPVIDAHAADVAPLQIRPARHRVLRVVVGDVDTAED